MTSKYCTRNSTTEVSTASRYCWWNWTDFADFLAPSNSLLVLVLDVGQKTKLVTHRLLSACYRLCTILPVSEWLDVKSNFRDESIYCTGIDTKKWKTKHYIHQKHKNKQTEKNLPLLTKETERKLALVYYSFYKLRPGNAAGVILTIPDPAQCASYHISSQYAAAKYIPRPTCGCWVVGSMYFKSWTRCTWRPNWSRMLA